MKQSTILLDPTGENVPPIRQLLERPHSLEGKTVGILDISKPRGDVFLKNLGELIAARGAVVKHYRKPTVTRLAPLPLRQQIAAECDLMVEGLAD